MAQLVEIKMVEGPAMIRNENGMRAGFVYVDIDDRDVGGYVEEARISSPGSLAPKGYSLNWSGQFENILRVKERLKTVVPLTNFFGCDTALYEYRSWIKTGFVMLLFPTL